MEIKKQVLKYNVPWWLVTIIIIFISFLLMVATFALYKIIHISKLSELNEMKVAEISIYISVFMYSFIAIISGILFAINYSFKERHRREESLEWELAGQRVKGIEESIKIIEEKIKAANNPEKNGLFVLDGDKIKELKKKIISLEKEKLIAIEAFGKSLAELKNENKIKNQIENNLRKEEKKRLQDINKIKKESNKKFESFLKSALISKEWILIENFNNRKLAERMFSLLYGSEAYKKVRNTQLSNELLILVNLADKKIRFYLNEKENQKDYYITNGNSLVFLNSEKKWKMFETELDENLEIVRGENNSTSIKSFSILNKVTVSYDGNFMFFESRYSESGTHQIKEIEATEEEKRSLKNIDKIISNLIQNEKTYSEKEIISVFESKNQIVNFWEYILYNFISEKEISKNRESIFKNLVDDYRVPFTSSSFPQNFDSLPTEERMYWALSQSHGIRDVQFAPSEFKDSWSKYNEFISSTTIISDEIERFKNEIPNFDIKLDFIRKFKTFYYILKIDEEIFECSLINKNEYRKYKLKLIEGKLYEQN